MFKKGRTKNIKKKYDVVIWIRKNKNVELDIEKQDKEVKIENEIISIYNYFYSNLNKVDDFFKLNNSILEKEKKERIQLINNFLNTKKIDEIEGETILGLSKQEAILFHKNIIDEEIIWLWGSIISKSMLIYFHSLFETFLSKILYLIYNNSPKQFNDNNIKFTFTELKKFDCIDDAKKYIINQKISNILYSSLDKQFEILFDLLWINKKEDKDNFPTKSLIEISLRRNLFTHEDGIVNDIYINKCIENWITNNFKKWEKIIFEDKYFEKVNSVYYEFLIKIIFYSWIKLSNDEKKYDIASWSFVCNRVFNLIKEKDFKLWLEISDFILESKFIKNVDEATKITMLINKALIFKMKKEKDNVKSILDRVDWTAKSDLFKFAKNILLEDWEKSWVLMIKTVIKDKKEEDEDYLWDIELRTRPLFFEFKEQDIFKKNYKKIFWKDFILDI